MPARAERGALPAVMAPGDATASTDTRVAIVLAVGGACVALHTAMHGGYLANPLLGVVSSATLVSFLVVPMATLVLLGERPMAPLAIGHWRRILPHFLLGLIAILGSTFVMGRMASFRSAYGITIGWELGVSTLVGMLCLEYFFRGFLLLPLFPKLSWYAAVLATVPYALVHVGKPLPELVASVPFGLYLSYLAVRSGSILYGVALHWVLAISLNFWVASAR